MNRLIIIGNGFDLAHGLKTSYSDFILDYLKNAIILCNKNRGTFNDDLIVIKNSSTYGKVNNLPFEDRINKHDNNKVLLEDAIFLGFKFDYSKSLLADRIINQTQYQNWVDIEREYYRLLKILKNQKDFDSLNKLNQDLEILKKKLIQYLIIVEQRNQVNTNSIHFKNISEIFKHNLISDLSGFHEKNIEMSNHNAKQGKYVHKTRFLNFNYTSLVESYIKKEGFKEISIHGKLNDPNSIVFGFGDEIDDDYKEIEKLDNNKYLEHIKSFKYFQYPYYSELESFLTENYFEIYIMGHSLGLSDRTLLNMIFEHENCLKIKIYFYKREDDTDDFTDLTFNLSRHFNNKGFMRRRVVDKTKSTYLPQKED